MRPNDGPLRCPSAQPGMADCQVLGVASDRGGEPYLSYLNEYLPATDEVLKLTGSVPPTEVFRLAARCEESKCTHFDGERCQLATRIVQILPAVAEALPPCIIRMNCRWYRQEGGQACLRCPQIITLNINANDAVQLAAGVPASAPEPAPAMPA